MSRALVAAIGVALIELVLHVWFAHRAPRFSEYQVLREPAERLRQSGDVVVVSPTWIEPMVRAALGDEVMPLSEVARPDLLGAKGVVEVSLGGPPGAEVADWVETETIAVHDFTLRRFENPRHERIVTDFVDAIDTARVFLDPDVRCMFNPLATPVAGDLGGHPTWPRRRFHCPGPPQVTVGVTVIADETWRPRRCILAHPPEHGAIRITFRDVELGTELIGHGGLYWMTERARRGAPIQLDVQVDEAEIGTFIHADGDGWRAFEMEVPPGRHDITFAVSSPGRDNRDFCFEVRSR